RCHHRAGGDDHFVFDNGAVHDHGFHADEYAVANGAAVQHGLVADGDVVANDQRIAAGGVVGGVGNVQYGAVLHAGTAAYADVVHIAPDHRQRPHRAVVAQFHITDYHGAAVDKNALAEFRAMALIGTDVCHGEGAPVMLWPLDSGRIGPN